MTEKQADLMRYRLNTACVLKPDRAFACWQPDGDKRISQQAITAKDL